jgi:hypothetical protein
MKLDLLYEVDVPKPWPGEHPHGQRAAEQQAYAEAIEQIRLADELGFHCSWHVEHHFREGRSHSPAPEVLIGALSQVTSRIRLFSILQPIERMAQHIAQYRAGAARAEPLTRVTSPVIAAAGIAASAGTAGAASAATAAGWEG